MSNGLPGDVRELRWEYPRVSRVLTVFCCALAVELFLLLYFPHILEPLRHPLLVNGVILLLAGVGVERLVWWKRRKWDRGITLSEDGIKVHGKFASWDEIERIERGPLLLQKLLPVRIKLKTRKQGFFDRAPPFERLRRQMHLRAYPFVYREVIPAVLKTRPDLQVPPSLESSLADPERACRLTRWPLFIVLAVDIGLLKAMISPACHDVLHYHMLFLVPALLFQWTVWSAFLLVGQPRDDREQFLLCALSLPGPPFLMLAWRRLE